MPRPKVHPTLEKLEEVSKGYGFPVAMTGYIGPASDGTVRLYPQLNLPEYIEIAEDAILHFDQPSDVDQTTLYVDPSAKVRIVAPALDTMMALKDAGPSGGTGKEECTKKPKEECIKCMYDRCIEIQKEKGATDESAKKICDTFKQVHKVICMPVTPPKKPEILTPA